jgi:hypothetical protein
MWWGTWAARVFICAVKKYYGGINLKLVGEGIVATPCVTFSSGFGGIINTVSGYAANHAPPRQ